ncbi:MAG: SRPBCC family protein [Burkholderiaceae bacterium]|nr:SRPBCC family protein [Burkholderiaceae bacterium]
MKVQLEKTFPMPASADVAWALLQDIEGVAACMPGAKVTERIDDTHYKGTVALKLGPANMSFRGDIEVKRLDAAARTLQLLAKGTDSAGGSGATMDLTARVDAVDAASCNLIGTSDVSVSGKAATFGQRFMGPVTDQILGQFAANFAARVQAMQATAAAPAVAGSAPATPPPVAEAKPLNGLALLWAVLKGWLGSLFGRRA